MNENKSFNESTVIKFQKKKTNLIHTQSDYKL